MLAVSSDTSNITAYQATITETTADNSVGIGMFLASLVAPNSPTVDVSHISITPTIESVTASQVNVAPDISHLAITPTINGIETDNSSDRTQWTNENKPTAPTWTNQDK